jgi:hypothetical protein
MKKLIALIAVCGFALAFVACGGKKEEAAATDSTTVETAPVAPADSTADSTGVATDSTAH